MSNSARLIWIIVNIIALCACGYCLLYFGNQVYLSDKFLTWNSLFVAISWLGIWSSVKNLHYLIVKV